MLKATTLFAVVLTFPLPEPAAVAHVTVPVADTFCTKFDPQSCATCPVKTPFVFPKMDELRIVELMDPVKVAETVVKRRVFVAKVRSILEVPVFVPVNIKRPFAVPVALNEPEPPPDPHVEVANVPEVFEIVTHGLAVEPIDGTVNVMLFWIGSIVPLTTRNRFGVMYCA
jgi:hypothetical protein